MLLILSAVCYRIVKSYHQNVLFERQPIVLII